MADDRPHPLADNKVADLTRGSVGANDPLIGPVVLAPGTYYAVVSTGGPTEVAGNPALRLSSVASVTTAALPVFGPVPWFLHDVSMFVVTEQILENPLANRRHTVSDIHVVDPYTGLREVDLAQFNYDVGDIDMRENGILNAFSVNWHEDQNGDLGVQSDANACIFLEINDHTTTTMDGSVNDAAGNCGITTWVQDPAGDPSDGPDPVIAHPYTPPGTNDLQRIGYGINIDAMVFTQNTLVGVGRRGDFDRDPAPAGVEDKQNLLFDFDPASGSVKNIACATHPDPGPTAIEAWTNACIIGTIQTGAGLTGTGGNDGVTEVTGGGTDWIINDGDVFTLDDGLNPLTFEIDLGPQVDQNIREDSSDQVLRDGMFFQLDNPRTGGEDLFQFDTGPIIQVNAGITGADVDRPNSGAVETNAVVVQVSANHPTTGSAQVWDFEFNTPGDPTYGGGNRTVVLVNATDNYLQVAAKLQQAIDGLSDTQLNADAILGFNRITLTREQWASVVSNNKTTDGRQVISIEGSPGFAPIVEIMDVDRISSNVSAPSYPDKIELELSGGGATVHTEVIPFYRSAQTDVVDPTNQTFTSDPGWSNVGSANNGNNYGWSNTTNAGGAAGEIGGRFTRTNSTRYLADNLLDGLTLDAQITASGKLDLTDAVFTEFHDSLNLGHFDSSGAPELLAFGFNFTDQSSAADGASSVDSADLDDDGDIDILFASAEDDTIGWYENTGGVFTTNIITTLADGVSSVHAVDLNDDTFVDFISASANSGSIDWWLNDGSGGFTPKNISITATGASSVYAADVNGDGYTDILSASAGNDTIALYLSDGTMANPGTPGAFPTFSSEVITDLAVGASSVYAFNIDAASGDTDMDVLSTSAGDNTVSWYENVYDWVQRGADIDGEAAGDGSGRAVAISADGTTIAIGAAGHDGANGTDSGQTRIYDFDGTNWVQRGDDIDGEELDDQSGYSVALSADGLTVAIGAPLNNDGGVDSGQTRIYDWNSTSSTWVQRGADIDGEAAADRSGSSVALSADGLTVAIGAYLNDGINGADSGQTRIYDWNSTSSTWVQRGADIDGEAADNLSGVSVALSADGLTVAIGAPGNDAGGADSGQTRIYDWNSTTSTWDLRGTDIDGEAADDWSGGSVALSADGLTVAIGAPGNDAGGADSGQTRIYDFDGTNWVQRGADIDGEAAGDWSGGSVALSADGLTVAIGTTGNDDGGADSGQTRIYDWNSTTSTWDLRGTDIDGEAADDWSGGSVALSDDGLTVAIGAILNDDGGADSGHARVLRYETFIKHDIDTAAIGAIDVMAGDINNDGRIDIIAASKLDNTVAWHENDGSENFTKHIISNAILGPTSIDVRDIETPADGDLDVFVSGSINGVISWFENNAGTLLDAVTLSPNAYGATDVHIADIDSDNNLDVVSASRDDDKIAWYQNDGAQNFARGRSVPSNQLYVRARLGAELSDPIQINENFDLDWSYTWTPNPLPTGGGTLEWELDDGSLSPPSGSLVMSKTQRDAYAAAGQTLDSFGFLGVANPAVVEDGNAYADLWIDDVTYSSSLVRDPHVLIEPGDTESDVAFKFYDELQKLEYFSGIPQWDSPQFGIPRGDLVAIVPQQRIWDGATGTGTVSYSLNVDITGFSQGGAVGIYDVSDIETIEVEETDTTDVIGVALAKKFNQFHLDLSSATPAYLAGYNWVGIDVSYEGDRINFSGDQDCDLSPAGDALSCEPILLVGPRWGDFRGVRGPNALQPAVWQAGKVGATQGGVTPGHIRIGLMTDDDMDEVVRRIAAVINASYGDENPASAAGDALELYGVEVTDLPTWLDVDGSGPGGHVTGMAALNGTIFAVSDRGGLYEIDLTPPEGSLVDPGLRVQTRYEERSRTDLLGVEFSGLTAGPQDVEGGLYSNLLFGVTDSGRVYAFNEFGELQPVFANSANSIQLRYFDTTEVPPQEVALTDVRGLAFSTLDNNLFEFAPSVRPTTLRDQRIIPSLTVGNNIAVGTQGQYHFGEGHVNGTPLTYDYEGGAHGTIISNEFSLRGYNGQDRPVLFFDYFVDTGAGDTFDVFITDNSGDWIPLQTLGGTGGNTVQARIPLDRFSGVEHLRLRFDFSTGAKGAGGPHTTGDELRAVEGQYLRDGDTFSLLHYEMTDGMFVPAPTPNTMIMLPPGDEIVDEIGQNSTLELSGPLPLGGTWSLTFEFDLDDDPGDVATDLNGNPHIRVPVDVTDSAQDVAVALRDAMPPGTGELKGSGAVYVSGGSVINSQPQGLFNVSNNEPREPDRFERFDVEMGFTLVVPSAGAIDDGETFDVTDHLGTTFAFEFDYDDPPNVSGTNERIFIEPFESAATVVSKMAIAIETAFDVPGPDPSTVITHQRGERLNLEINKFEHGAMEVTVNAAHIRLEGDVSANAENRVFLHEEMTRNEVADELNRITEGNVYGPTIVVPDGSFFTDDYWSNGTAIREADWFAIGDGVNMTSYEFDSGIWLKIFSGLEMSDGVQVNFTDGTESHVFEIDKDGNWDTSATQVPINAIDTPWEVAQTFVDIINTATDGQTLDLDAKTLEGARVLVRSNRTDTRAEVSEKAEEQKLTFVLSDGTGVDPDITDMEFQFTLEIFNSLNVSLGTTGPIVYDPLQGAAASAGAIETELDLLAGVPNGFNVVDAGSTAASPIWDITYPSGNDYAKLGVDFPVVNASTDTPTPGGIVAEVQRVWFQPSPPALAYQFKLTVSKPNPGNPDIVGTTDRIDWNADPLDIAMALDAMANATPGLTAGYAVAVGGTGSITAPWVITYPGTDDYNQLSVFHISRIDHLGASVVESQSGDFGPTTGGITGVMPGRIPVEFEPSSFWRTEQVSNAIVDAINAQNPLDVTAELKDFTTSHVRLNHDTESNWEIVVCLNDPYLFPVPAPFPPVPPPNDNPHDNLCYYDPSMYLPGGAIAGTITTDANGPLKTHAADIDGDGDQDVLSAQFQGDDVLWYENDGQGNFTSHVVSDDVNYAAGVFSGDFDQDNDIDVVSASMNDDTIYWHENIIDWFGLGDDIDGIGANDKSGTAISLSNDGLTVAIGEPGNGFVAGQTRIYRYDVTAETWNELGLTGLTSPIMGEAGGDRSGSSVALSGDGTTVAIGAPNNSGDGTGAQTGHVRLYRYNPNTDAWNQLGTDVDGQALADEFGFSVSLSDDGSMVSIGAHKSDANGNNSGQVRNYRFDQLSSDWVDYGLPINGSAADDEFGISISLTPDGTRVAVGSHLNDTAGPDRGQVRIFEYNATTDAWEVQGAINGEEDGEHFGFAVSLNDAGTRIAVGADLSDAGGTDRGSVRVYDFNTTTTQWAQIGNDRTGVVDDDQFGFSVSLSGDGNSFAVGAFGDDTVGGQSGQTRIYDLGPATAISYSNDFDGNETFGPAVGGGLTGVTTVEPVQGYAGLGTPGNQFSGSFLRNATPTSSLPHGAPGQTNQATTLTLTNLPQHDSIDIRMLLGIIDSWDGMGGTNGHQPDVFNITVDGTSVFSHAMTEFEDPARHQTYVPPTGGALAVSTQLGFTNPGAGFADSAYDLSVEPTLHSIPHAATTLTIAWFADGAGWTGGADESWAIDKVEIRLNDSTASSWVQRGIDLNGEAAGDESGRSVSISADGLRVAIGAPENNGGIGHTRVYEYGRQFLQHVINDSAMGARSVFAIDLDADGLIDVLSASHGDGGVYTPGSSDNVSWYKNLGGGVFSTENVIAAGVDGFSVFAVDMNDDGNLDVLATSREQGTVTWYEHDGTATPTVWTPHEVTNSADAAMDAFAVDLDGDGHVDVLSASMNDDTIAWYKSDGAVGVPNFSSANIITGNMDGARSVFANDLDNDGDADVMAASSNDDKVFWFENDGLGNFTPHPLNLDAEGASSVYSADLNSDGFPDIISSSYGDNTVQWYEKDSTYIVQPPISPLTLEAEVGDHELDVDNIKQHEDLLQLWYGIDVIDPGPFGFQNHMAPTEAALPLQDNQHEGAYLSTVHVDFTERGLAVGGSDSTATVGGGGGGIAVGAYQLEIRRGSFDPLLAPPFIPMDTNDRLTQSYTLEVPAGSNIIDGQTFDLSDSVNSVRFEYDDTSIGVSAFEGVTAGNMRVPFDSEMEDWEVARLVRDLINSGPVQATIDVAASLSDGVDGMLFPDVNDADNERDLRILNSGTSGITTSNEINLFGAVYVVTDTNVLRTPVQEQASNPDSNDTLATATPTAVSGFNSPMYVGQGSIGDNPNLPLTPGLDVDLFEVLLNANDELTISLQSQFSSASLDTRVRIFDAGGNQRHEEFDPGNDLNFTYTPTDPGLNTFYVGVSAFDNDNYNSQVSSSGTTGDVGPYKIELSFAAIGTTDFTAFEKFGDQNHFRDQGQILIHANTVSNSQNFGILVDQEKRYGPIDGNSPHQGSVRHLDEINDQNLTTGVVVTNNLLYRNQQGGIHISGALTTATQPQAPLSFGRVVNNTVYGVVAADGTLGTDVGIQVSDNASPTLLNNLLAGLGTAIQVDGTSGSTVVGGSLYQNNFDDLVGATEDFPIHLAATAPLFINPTPGIDNFYLAPSTLGAPNLAIDSSIGSLQERFEFNLIKAPLNIAPSPILAPTTDVAGQNRHDDPGTESPGGLGSVNFVDRGAMDRVDTSGPVVVMTYPADNDADGQDQNSGNTVIRLSADAVVPYFDIRLNDGEQLAAAHEGIGIEDTSVTTAQVIVRRDGQLLQDNVDYSFSYNGNNDTIRLTPLAGIWPQDSIYTINFINRDQWSLVAPHWDAVSDGDRFNVTDLAGNETALEIEFGYLMEVPQTLEMQVDEAGAGAGGIEDGDYFTVRNGSNPEYTFEFDSNGESNHAGGSSNVLIPFLPGVNTQNDIAELILANLAANPTYDVGLSPVNLGEGRIHLGSRQAHQVTLNSSHLTLSGQPGGVAEGDRFSVDDGTKLVTFEFYEPPLAVVTTDSDRDIVQEIQSIEVRIPSEFTVTISYQGARTVDPVTDGNGFVSEVQSVALEHVSKFSLTLKQGGADAGTTGEMESTVSVADLETNLANLVPGTTVTGSGTNADPWIVTYGNTQNYDLLEVTSTGTVIGTTGLINSTASSIELQAELSSWVPFTSVTGEGTNASPWRVAFGGTDDYSPLELTPQSLNGNQPVVIIQSDTYEDIANTIVSELKDADLGLQPYHLDEGRIFVGGTIGHQLTTDALETRLTSIGRPGVRPELSLQIPTVAGVPTGLSDAETFLITVGGNTVVFELNNIDVDASTDLSHVRIDFNNSTTTAQLATQIELAIKSAGLNLDPVHEVGTNIIRIDNSTTSDVLDTSDTSLVTLGNPGVPAAVLINLTEHFEKLSRFQYNDRQIAVAILDAIERDTILTGVEAWPAGGANITLAGVQGVSEISRLIAPGISDLRHDQTWTVAFDVQEPTYITEIEDRAANSLKANQLSGETKYTIKLGSVSLEAGDAVDGLGQPPQNAYPVLSDSDGAIHVIPDQLSETLWLGSRMDRDSEGQSLIFEITGDASAMQDGEQFVITKGTRSEFFEFDLDVPADTSPNTTPITVSSGDSVETIAQTVATAINDANLGMFVRHLGGGKLLLGTNYEISIAGAPQNISITNVTSLGDDLDGDGYDVTITGSGVIAASPTLPSTLTIDAASISDGDVVEISDGLITATFEFEDSTVTDGVIFGNFAVPFATGDSDAAVATALVAAIDQATVDADLMLNLNPLQTGADVELSGDDEDGVTDAAAQPGDAIGFLSPYVKREIVVTASGDGLLDAWIDFNRDGDWDDAAEQIFSSQQLLAGPNTLIIDTPYAPDFKAGGESFARFRISSMGGLRPTGLTFDGETEDYAVILVDGTPPVPISDPQTAGDLLYRTSEDLLLTGPSLLVNDHDVDGDDFRILDRSDSSGSTGTFSFPSDLGAQITLDKTYKSVFPTGGTFAYDPRGADSSVPNGLDQLAGPQDIIAITESGNHLVKIQTGVLTPPAPLRHGLQIGDEVLISNVTGSSSLETVLNDQILSVSAVTEDSFTLNVAFPASATYSGNGTVVHTTVDTFTYDLIEEIDVPNESYGFISETSGTVTVTVTGDNDKPVANNAYTAAVEDGQPVQGYFNGDDVDVDDTPETLFYTITQTVPIGQGTLSNNDDGTFTFSPGSDFQELAEGVETLVPFEYTATDQHNLTSDPGNGFIIVTGVNDDPISDDDIYLLNQDKMICSSVMLSGCFNALDATVISPTDGDGVSVQEVQTVALDSSLSQFSATINRNGAVVGTTDLMEKYEPPQMPPTAEDVVKLETLRAELETNLDNLVPGTTVVGVGTAVVTTLTPGGSASEVQTVALNGVSKFSVTYSLGGTVVGTTDVLGSTVSAADLKMSLNDLVPVTSVTGSGTDLDPWQVTFTGTSDHDELEITLMSWGTQTEPWKVIFGDTQDYDPLKIGRSMLVPVATIETLVEGDGSSAVEQQDVVMPRPALGTSVVPGAFSVTINQAGTAIVLPIQDGNGSVPEVQTVELDSVSKFSVTLSQAGIETGTTGEMDSTVTAVYLGTELSNLVPGTTVTGSGTNADPWIVTYGNTQNYDLLEVTWTGTEVGTTAEMETFPIETPLSASNIIKLENLRVELETNLDNLVSGTTVTGTGTSAASWLVTFGNNTNYDSLQFNAGLFVNDSDLDLGDTLTLTAINWTEGQTQHTQSLNGGSQTTITTARGATLTVYSSGEFVYNPTYSDELKEMIPGQMRADSFGYVVEDSQGAVAQENVEIVVTGVNNRPEPQDDEYEIDQNEILTVPFGNNIPSLLANDHDPDLEDHVGVNVLLSRLNGQLIGNNLQISGQSQHGAEITLTAGGVLTYDPTVSTTLLALNGGSMLEDQFTYSLIDNHGQQSLEGTATVHVDVWGVNKGPTVETHQVPENVGVNEDTLYTAGAPGVLANATDPEGDPFSATGVVTQAVVVTLTEGGSVSEVQTVDLENVTKFSVTVSEVGVPPIGTTSVMDSTVSATDLETSLSNLVPGTNVTGAGTTADPWVVTFGDTANYIPLEITAIEAVAALTGKSHFGAVVTLASSGDGSFTYNPIYAPELQEMAEGAHKDDYFTYRVTDSHGASSDGQVEIYVTGLNDLPESNDDAYVRLPGVQVIDILANDTDVDKYVSDGAVASTLTMVCLTEAPTDSNTNGHGNGQPAGELFESASNDAGCDSLGGDLLTLTFPTDTLRPNGNSVTYSPGGFGTPIVVTETEGGSVSEVQTVDLKTVTKFSVTLSQGGTEVGTTGVMDSTVSAAVLQTSLSNLLAGTTVTGAGTTAAPWEVTYGDTQNYDPLVVTPIVFHGLATFKYLVKDDFGWSDSNDPAEVTILVNQPPDAEHDPKQTLGNETEIVYQGQITPIHVLDNDEDPDSDELVLASVTVVSQPSNGLAVAVPETGDVLYTPNSPLTLPASDTFTYKVQDTHGAWSDEATVYLTISPDPTPWQNKPLNEDVDDSGQGGLYPVDAITPIDALLAINVINAGTYSPTGCEVPVPNTCGLLPITDPNDVPPPYYDVTGDGFLTANDVNAVISKLNENASGGSGEGEAEGEGESAAAFHRSLQGSFSNGLTSSKAGGKLSSHNESFSSVETLQTLDSTSDWQRLSSPLGQLARAASQAEVDGGDDWDDWLDEVVDGISDARHGSDDTDIVDGLISGIFPTES